MPELGKYAAVVLTAYGVSIALLVLLVGLSIRQAARMRTRLRDVEERTRE